MKLTIRQLRELIQEVSNEEIILDPFEKIVDYNIAHENKTNLKSYSLSVAGSVAGAILMETLVVFARYVAPEVIDYIKSQLIDKGVEYAYKVFAYKIFEMLLNDDSFTADGLSPLRLFPSIDRLRLNKQSLFFLKGMNPEEVRNFKMHVSREIMKTDDHPFKVDVDSIFSRTYLTSESKIRQMIRESMGPIPFNPGERRNLPGIADDVHNELIDAEVINFPTDEPDNMFDKVINIALNAKNAESVETLNLDVKSLFTKERDANGILANFVSEMSYRMSKQGLEFDDERQMLQMQATEGAADLVDSLLGVSLDIPENKAIHLQHASDATEMLMDALQNLNLV